MKKLIWTKHALQRTRDRKIPQQYLTNAFYRPDKVIEGKKKGSKKFIRSYGLHQAVVVASSNDKGEWVAISGWINPPIKGSLDDRKKLFEKNYQKSSFWGKTWLVFKKSILGR
ncbi:MAG: hypothetical protein ABIB61_04830 [Candidatus Shapirobacteria bacterium]